MSTRKKISRILSILMIASMVLSYNSSIAFSVWAATDDTTEVAEEAQDSNQKDAQADDKDSQAGTEDKNADSEEAKPGEEKSDAAEEAQAEDGNASSDKIVKNQKKVKRSALANGDINVTINFYNEDGLEDANLEAPDPVPAGKYYIRSIIRSRADPDSEEPPEDYAWALTPINLDSASNSVTVPADSFKTVEDSESVSLTELDDEKYEIVHRLIHGNSSINTYSEAMSASDAPPANYAWKSSGSSTLFKLQKQERPNKNYYIRVDFNDPKASFDGSEKIYAAAAVRHQNSQQQYGWSDYTFGYTLIKDEYKDPSNPGVYIVPINEWKTKDGTPIDGEVFTGNEKEVRVFLGTPSSGDTIKFEANNGEVKLQYGGGAIASEGGSVNQYTITYCDCVNADNSGERITEADPDDSTANNYYDNIRLSKTSVKLTDYSLENIIGSYGLVTLCENDDSKTHTREGIQYTDGDLYLGTHTMAPVLIRGDWLPLENGPGISDSQMHSTPSYIGGKVPEANSLANGGARQTVAGRETPDLIIGSANTTVLGNIINGIDRGADANKNGRVIRVDDYVDWNKLQSGLISTSEKLAAQSTRTIDITESTTIEVTIGENVTLDYKNPNAIVSIEIVGKDGQEINSIATVDPTIINCKGDSINPFPLISKIGSVSAGAYLDDPAHTPTYLGVKGSQKEDGDGMSIIFNLPNTTDIVTSSNDIVGHILAPRADVYMPGANYNGCIIANSIFTRAEGHLWPYKSGKITEECSC